MEQNSFTFYRSYFEAVSQLPKHAQAAALLAICDYALNDAQPQLTGVACAIFALVKPNLDASKRKARSGKKGGEAKAAAKQTDSSAVANGKQIDSEVGGRSLEVGGKRLEVGDRSLEDLPPPRAEELLDSALSCVMSAYLDKINPTPSQTSLDELAGYVERMGAEICLRAMDRALDAKKATWNYIRGILRSLEGQGVRCTADWDRLDAERERRKHGSTEAAGGALAQDAKWDLPGVTKL